MCLEQGKSGCMDDRNKWELFSKIKKVKVVVIVE